MTAPPVGRRAEDRTVPSIHARLATTAILSSSAVGTAILALRADDPHPQTLLLLAVSIGGLGAVLCVPALRLAISRRLVAGLATALLVVAVIPQPPFGADLWVYAVYGRIVVDQGDSPYVHPPADYPEDPWVQDLQLFRDGRTFYGPVFIGMTAAIASVGGDSRLAVRLGYQVGAALAVAGTLLLLARARASAAGLALLALNPVVIVEIVAQGRMDAYIGLALLLGALLAGRRRPHLAALAIAGAALIKIPAALALVALVAWVWRRCNVRKAGVVAATGAAAVGLAYLLAGGAEAVRPLLDARSQSNDVNIWVLARENGLALALGDLQAQLGPVGSTNTLALIAALALGALLLVARLDERSPVFVLALPMLAYLLTSTYPTARYVAWILPLLALRLRTRATAIAVALSSAILLFTQYRAALYLQRGDSELSDFLVPLDDGLFRAVHSAPIAIELAGIVLLAVGAVRVLRRDAPGRSQSSTAAGSAPR